MEDGCKAIRNEFHGSGRIKDRVGNVAHRMVLLHSESNVLIASVSDTVIVEGNRVQLGVDL